MDHAVLGADRVPSLVGVKVELERGVRDGVQLVRRLDWVAKCQTNYDRAIGQLLTSYTERLLVLVPRGSVRCDSRVVGQVTLVRLNGESVVCEDNPDQNSGLVAMNRRNVHRRT